MGLIELTHEQFDTGSDSLFQYEKKILSNTDRFKFGLLYVKADQTGDENAMFSNTEGSEEFHHFMSVLGEKVPLKVCRLAYCFVRFVARLRF